MYQRIGEDGEVKEHHRLEMCWQEGDEEEEKKEVRRIGRGRVLQDVKIGNSEVNPL